MKIALGFTTFLLCVAAIAADSKVAVEDSITVEVVGTFHTGIVATGGATTGTTITSNGITWELELAENLRSKVDDFDGKQVFVRGSLERRAETEIKERWIVTVSDLRLPGSQPQKATKRRFKAKAGRSDTKIQFFQIKGETTAVEVKSEFGIDNATITRTSKKWPREVLVRLHLHGLESFKVSSGETAVEWSMSGSEGNAVHASLHEGKEVSEVGKDSPYLTEVEIVGENKTIPLNEGYFEVMLPAKLFAENPREITLSWVDFYRN